MRVYSRRYYSNPLNKNYDSKVIFVISHAKYISLLTSPYVRKKSEAFVQLMQHLKCKQRSKCDIIAALIHNDVDTANSVINFIQHAFKIN
jgi:hypothetical protein